MVVFRAYSTFFTVFSLIPYYFPPSQPVRVLHSPTIWRHFALAHQNLEVLFGGVASRAFGSAEASVGISGPRWQCPAEEQPVDFCFFYRLRKIDTWRQSRVSSDLRQVATRPQLYFYFYFIFKEYWLLALNILESQSPIEGGKNTFLESFSKFVSENSYRNYIK